ncbi:hypothetical protein JCM8097_005328 [Rhodosporidiobolus ruineniae]
MSGRVIPPLLALTIGVGSGVYIFKPLLESYKESTNGTFRPEDDHHSAPVPPLPFTSLQPGKTADGKDLLEPPAQDPVAIVEKQQQAQRKV